MTEEMDISVKENVKKNPDTRQLGHYEKIKANRNRGRREIQVQKIFSISYKNKITLLCF